MKTYSKTEAISIIVNCAKRYEKELLGNTILLICQKKFDNSIYCIEFNFYEHNFLHLTGVKLNKTIFNETENIKIANSFFNKCLKGRLNSQDINFKENGVTQLKLHVLPKLISKDLSARMIGNYTNSKPKLITNKLTGGQNGCIGFIKDSKTLEFVPNTILDEDIRNYIEPVDKVIAVLRKKKDDIKYNEITYKSKNKKNPINWSKIKLPNEYIYLLDLIKNN